MSRNQWYQWTGGDYTPELMAFLRQRPGVIFWAEAQLLNPGAVLAITYELSEEHPIRVPPGAWIHFDGRHFSWFERGPAEQAGPQKLRGPAVYNVLDAAEGRNPWSHREVADE